MVKQSEHWPLLLARPSSPTKMKQQNVCPNRGKRRVADAEVNVALEFGTDAAICPNDEAEQAAYCAKRGVLHLEETSWLATPSV